MDAELRYHTLLEAARHVYEGHAELTDFVPFPKDVRRQPIVPQAHPCSALFQNDDALKSVAYPDLQQAIVGAAPVAHWRETYKDTDIGADFLTRFGCYCIIGEGGPYLSSDIRLYMVYMPAHFYYPWHHHPAEEIYLVVSGSALFKKGMCADEVLSPGQTSFHKSNQPHAMATQEEPVLCLVAWRDQFETPPVWTPQMDVADGTRDAAYAEGVR